jgi:negative regulator of sigma-B (phosphoserine phosphatase)
VRPDEPGLLEWCTAGRPLPGQERSGDDALVLADERRALVAAIDGLGHGAPASEAAEVAVAALRQDPWEDVEALTWRCHEALRATRGAAVGLAAFREEGTVTWLGVGNITGRLVSGGGLSAPAGRWLGSLSGVAGDDELPPLRPTTMPVRRGDVLILVTDGIDGAFADEVVVTGTCAEIADRVLRDFGRASDDALVVVARYLAEDR